MSSIVVLGEALIDLFAEKGAGLEDAAALYPAPGGAPANVAVALGRLGARVAFIGKVGADGFGRLLQATLSQHGVDTRFLGADPRAPTMLAVVASPGPEEQQFVLYSGASELLDAAELPLATIAGAEVFVFGSVTLATRSRDAALAAALHARRAGRHVLFDVNFRPALWPDADEARAQIEAALRTATILKVNEAELEFLTGTSDPARGSPQLLATGAELCCVSLGGRGAFFATDRARGHVPAFAVEVRDTTGSGDAFVAGLAFQVSGLERPLKELGHSRLAAMVRFANACGAIVATQQGAMRADLTPEAVERLLRAQGEDSS